MAHVCGGRSPTQVPLAQAVTSKVEANDATPRLVARRSYDRRNSDERPVRRVPSAQLFSLAGPYAFERYVPSIEDLAPIFKARVFPKTTLVDKRSKLRPILRRELQTLRVADDDAKQSAGARVGAS